MVEIPIDLTARSAGRPRSEAYWAIVWRQLRAKRLAMLGLGLIAFVATVAAFVPLLANNRPLYFQAAVPDLYDEAYFTLLDAIDQLDGLQKNDFADRDAAAQKLGYAYSGIERMSRQLTAEKARPLREMRERLESGFRSAANPSAEQWRRIAAIKERIADELDTLKIELQPLTLWPAFRALGAIEIFFLAEWFLALCYLLLLRRRINSLARFACYLFIPALLAALIWRWQFPPYHDTLNYKAIVQEQASTARAVFPPVPYGENENITEDRRLPPTWLMTAQDRAKHPRYHALGTDTNGRDVLCRMIYGARIAISIGFVAVGIYIAIGIVLGALAGYCGGWTDILISRAIELMICFPVFFLILIVLAFFRPNIFSIMVVIGVTGWTGVARLQRGEFLRLINLEYVQAIRALGGSNLRIIFLHMLPNGIGPILVVASFGVASAILTESALSFLGFGVPQPAASWGDILNNGRNDIQGNWWLTIFPGLAIFLTVTAYNLFGEGLRDAIDPRLKQ